MSFIHSWNVQRDELLKFGLGLSNDKKHHCHIGSLPPCYLKPSEDCSVTVMTWQTSLIHYLPQLIKSTFTIRHFLPDYGLPPPRVTSNNHKMPILFSITLLSSSQLYASCEACWVSPVSPQGCQAPPAHPGNKTRMWHMPNESQRPNHSSKSLLTLALSLCHRDSIKCQVNSSLFVQLWIRFYDNTLWVCSIEC